MDNKRLLAEVDVLKQIMPSACPNIIELGGRYLAASGKMPGKRECKKCRVCNLTECVIWVHNAAIDECAFALMHRPTYSKEELLAMMPAKKNLDTATSTTYCAGDNSYSERCLFDAQNYMIERCADAIADKMEKPQALKENQIMHLVLKSGACRLCEYDVDFCPGEKNDKCFARRISQNIRAAMKKDQR